MLQTRIADRRAEKIEIVKIDQPFQMHQAGVGDRCVLQMQPIEVGQSLDVRQVGVFDFRAAQVESDQAQHVPQKHERFIYRLAALCMETDLTPAQILCNGSDRHTQ